jgi:hypothetical protein
MHITMVKKRLTDGSECRKCIDATAMLRSKGLLDRIDDIVWAFEDDPTSPGMVMADELQIDQAPFFVVRDQGVDAVYTSVLQLVRDRLGAPVTLAQQALAIDIDDLGV